MGGDSVSGGTLEIEQSMSSDKEMNNGDEQSEREADKRLELIEVYKEPRVGLIFNSTDDLFTYYSRYAQQQGFDVLKRTSKTNDDGVVNYVVFACAQTGKPGKLRASVKNSLNPKPTKKTQCKAKLNASMCYDGKFIVTIVRLEHNHLLCPGKTHMPPSNRRLKPQMKRKLETNDQAESVNKNSNPSFVEEWGFVNLPPVEKDSHDYIDRAGKLRLGNEDVEAIRRYFVKMQSENAGFFYVIDLDDEVRLRNIFWTDARNRAAYEEFGDVVTFDTTYLENKYDIPLFLFVGVNHHGQSLLFGCGLILNEDFQSFVWLFESWLACMSGHAPEAIITNQYKAIQRAIERVFPTARHRWCLSSIMNKIAEKLREYTLHELIKADLENVVYDSLTQVEFETGWEGTIQNYGLQSNEWLGSLYSQRHCWVPIYVKDVFWAGMSTTQRNESLRAFFDGYVNLNTTLRQFVEEYDNALRSKVEMENFADYNSLNSWMPCITHYDIEKQFQEVYTNAKFKEFQEELGGKIYCDLSFVKDEGAISVYEVSENIKFGERTKYVVFSVYFKEDDCDVQCMCHLFESKGIICRHMISLFIHKKVQRVPLKYILPRWRKHLKRRHTRVKVSYDDGSAKPWEQRFNKICNSFQEVADMGAASDDKYMMVINSLRELKVKLHDNGIVSRSNASYVSFARQNFQ